MACRVLIDTSLAWVMAWGPRHLAGALRGFFRELGSRCTLLYSEASLEELYMAATPQQRRAVISVLQSMASLAPPYLDEVLQRIGRYEKWVRRIGEHDVMIALTAKDNDAVLATGDWGQAKFYISLTGTARKLLYIPVVQLKNRGGEGEPERAGRV